MQRAVAEFHRASGLPDRLATPAMLPTERIAQRLSALRRQGPGRLDAAIASGDEQAMITAMVNTIYISLGALVEMGCPVRELPVKCFPHLHVGLSVTKSAGMATHALATQLDYLKTALTSVTVESTIEGFSALARDAYWFLVWAGLDPMEHFQEAHRINLARFDKEPAATPKKSAAPLRSTRRRAAIGQPTISVSPG